METKEPTRPAPSVTAVTAEPIRKEISKISELYREFASAHRLIHVGFGGFDDGFEYWLADNVLIVQKYLRDSEKEERRTLKPAVAEDAWLRIEKLDVGSWNQSYTPKDIDPDLRIYDGLSWGVRSRIGTKMRNSSGDNVYPARNPKGAPTLSVTNDGKPIPTAFHDLISILEELEHSTGASNQTKGGRVTNP